MLATRKRAKGFRLYTMFTFVLAIACTWCI